MWRRIYPKLVTLLGGVGLGLALTYLVGVALAFVPGWEDWTDFFVPRAMYLLVVPYLLLIGHLVLRNHVGRFLLRRQAYREARQYARRRLDAALLRSRREVANHRIVAARANIGLGDYDTAGELLDCDDASLPGTYAVEARRWRMELALRGDDRRRAAELVVQEPSQHDSRRGELAALLGAGAELALREEDRVGYEQQIEYALWEEGDHHRVQLARALAMLDPELDGGDDAEAAAVIEQIEESVGRDIPARRTELKALRAQALWRTGRRDEARELFDEVEEGPKDHWTAHVVEETRDMIRGRH